MPSVLGNLIEQADRAIQLMKQNDPDNPNIKQLKSLSQIANKLLMLWELSMIPGCFLEPYSAVQPRC